MKKYWLFALCVVSVFVIATAVLAAKGGSQGATAQLYLYEKNPADWTIVEDGAWGKMSYNPAGAKLNFVFNGHALEPGANYTLIYYPDPWPGKGLICLGNGVVNNGGNINIQGSVDTGDLPIATDTNTGAKIWLVLSSDVDCDNALMVGWNPTQYLFENNLITFDDTDS